MRSFSKFLAVAVGLGCAASLAFAADQTILGKSLTVKQKPGGQPTSRKITGSGKEKGSPNTLVGNPTLAGSAGGAILQVFANGANSTAQTFTLPSGNQFHREAVLERQRNRLQVQGREGRPGPREVGQHQAQPERLVLHQGEGRGARTAR